MRKFRRGCWTALVLAGAALPANADRSTKATTPHGRQLQLEINQRAARVNSASNTEEQCRELEELCTKLLQADDYDNALKVATKVYSTKGGNDERRAAHHYLIARIYALRMEASSSVRDMEQNRQKAYATAQEVTAQKYPEQWGVGNAAGNLMNELQDAQRLQLIRMKVEQRQSGGVGAGIEAVAKAQSANMHQSVKSKAEAVQARMNGLGAVSSQPSTVTSVSSDPAQSSLNSRLMREKAARSILINDSKGTIGSRVPSVSYSSSGAKISDTKSLKGSEIRGSGVLKTPIIIDGNTIYRAPGSSPGASQARKGVTATKGKGTS